MHFSRNPKKLAIAPPPLQVGRHAVQPSTKERILGVIFDSELRFKDHLAKVKSRGWKSASQLKRLGHIAPKAARQLYLATVASKTDYAASVWYSQFIGSKANNSTGKILNPIHRIGAQAVVKSFKTVSMEAASAEATLLLPHFRLQLKIGKLWVGLHSLPDSNPIKTHIRKLRVASGPKTFASPLQKIEAALGRPGESIEVIPAWNTPPWGKAAAIQLEDRLDTIDSALRRYRSTEAGRMNVFADGSIANGKAGIGLAAYNKRQIPFATKSNLIRNNDRIDSTSVELAAIRAATMLIDAYLEGADIQPPDTFQVTIWSDSKRAVDCIKDNVTSVAHSIRAYVEHQSGLGRQILIEWIPKMAKIPGHMVADREAKASTTPNNTTVSHKLDVPDSVAKGWDTLKKAIIRRAR